MQGEDERCQSLQMQVGAGASYGWLQSILSPEGFPLGLEG